MKHYKIISTLRCLNLDGDLISRLALLPGVDIITDRKSIKSIINKDFKKFAGVIEYDYYLKAGHILYMESTDESIFDGAGSHGALLSWLSWVGMLLEDVWLIKDNAVICESAFCRLVDNGVVEWTSNYLNTHVSNSVGLKGEGVDFSVSELLRWRDISHKLQTYRFDKSSTSYHSFTDKSYSRVSRATRFIGAARLDGHPATKIAHYCSALESLFSTDSSELTHKLSERVALFLRDNSYDPISVFKEVKSYYGIRSKVIHGDDISKKKAEQLPVLSDNCDVLLRSIMNIIISNPDYIQLFDGPKEAFEEYFQNKMFMVE